MKSIFLIPILLILGCAEKKTHEIAGIPMETIDFSSLKEKYGDIPEHFIKNKEYIHISTENKELLFGTIDQVEIKNGRIYIMDSRIKTLAVFNLHGKAVGKVGTMGRAPGEYLNINGFSIDSSDNIYLFDGRMDKDKINIYNKDFEFINSKKLPFEIETFRSLPDNQFMINLATWNEKQNAQDEIIVTDTNFTTQKTFCQYDEYIDNNISFSPRYFIETEQAIFYNRPLDNIVYRFSKNGIPVKGYIFDFGKKTIPRQAKKDYEKYKELYENTRALIFFTMVDTQYILGHLREEQPKTFFIDRQQNTVYITNRSSLSNLGHIIGTYENKIISCITPGEYLQAIEDHKHPNLPPEVVKHLENEGVALCLYELNL